MSKELDFAKNLASKAGKIIKDDFNLGKKIEWKRDDTPLTETDKKINNLIIKDVKKEFPGYSILAEEGSFLGENQEYSWVCDPLDGTIPFSRGIPISTFILSLVKKGESILGVVYDPYLDWMFTAEKGKGAFLNDKKISVSKIEEFKKTVVGFSSSLNHKINLFNVYKPCKNKNIHLLTLGSAGFMGALVACGRLDAYMASINSPYEAAALKIIVEEAGGKVTDIFGKDQRYDQKINGFLITNNLLHEKLIKLIEKNIC